MDKVKKAHEDRWFIEKDRELIAKLKEEREQRIREEEAKEAQKERDRLREAHWMRCPKCGHAMKERTLRDVKVDVCTLCEGVYFDRGELEDLMLAHQSSERVGFFRRLMGLGSE